MMQPVDWLVYPQYLMTTQKNTMQSLTEHALVIKGDSIVDILPSAQAKQQYTSKHQLCLDTHIVMPGFINSHVHAAMSLFRGLADDKPLMTWLNDYIWPAESSCVAPNFIQVGVTLACAEMIKSGVTTFNDMYFYPDVAATITQAIGIRCCHGLSVLDFPTNWAKNLDEYLAKSKAALAVINDLPLCYAAMAPHAPYTVGDKSMRAVLDMAESHDLLIQMHVHETLDEIEQSLKAYGVRPIKRLEQLGLLSSRLQSVHSVHLNDEDIDLLAKNQVQVIHCPESNLKLSSGFCPIARLLSANINVALGTDGAASNNDLDMMSEMKTAAILAKAVAQQATVVNASQALQMSTINGAKAMKLDNITGSLTVGKKADWIAVSLEEHHAMPCYHPEAHMVYSAKSTDVTHNMVNGQFLLKDKQLQTIDTHQLKNDVANWIKDIRQWVTHA